MSKIILLLSCVMALSSAVYANERDRAARTFGHQMDNLSSSDDSEDQDQQNVDNNNGDDNQNNQQDNQSNQDQNGQENSDNQENGNNEANNQGDFQNTDGDNGENNQSDNQSGHSSKKGPQVTLSQKVADLEEDMGRVMLRLDRLDQKLGNKKSATHKKKQITLKLVAKSQPIKPLTRQNIKKQQLKLAKLLSLFAI
ncbi:hypothetical protein [Candidatus Paracaedibacter symbiosus]|uniref:hypothetical protein n=1 Tax=Candidatus Paracaedibacter symbiosus TaxID=244582 RepID=UPI00068A358B|nr:hypothetical protein [Candidatus Paracaedibacter symbiosus]